MKNSNDYVYIKARIDVDLLEGFKKMLAINGTTIQDFFEKQINDYVIKNLKLILKDDNKGLEIEK